MKLKIPDHIIVQPECIDTGKISKWLLQTELDGELANLTDMLLFVILRQGMRVPHGDITEAFILHGFPYVPKFRISTSYDYKKLYIRSGDPEGLSSTILFKLLEKDDLI